MAFMLGLAALYPKASVKDYVDHIDYIVKHIGIDHVGIGTDFNHGAGIMDFGDESQAPNVTLELVRRGYNQARSPKSGPAISCAYSATSRWSRASFKSTNYAQDDIRFLNVVGLTFRHRSHRP